MTRNPLPRNTTKQAEAPLYGRLARLLNRLCGMVIVVFVFVHVVVQAVNHVPQLTVLKAGAPWLGPLQTQHWIHAILFFSIGFHTLYGLKLLAGELGWRTDYRKSLIVIGTLSGLLGLREVLRYGGI